MPAIRPRPAELLEKSPVRIDWLTAEKLAELEDELLKQLKQRKQRYEDPEAAADEQCKKAEAEEDAKEAKQDLSDWIRMQRYDLIASGEHIATHFITRTCPFA